MDNAKLLAALEESEARLTGALQDPGTDIRDYGLLVDNLARVRGMADAIAKRGAHTPYDESPAYCVDPHTVEPTPESEPTIEPEATPEPEPEPEATPEPEPEIKPCPKPEHKMTKAEARTTLTAYANAGVDVHGIMRSMGFAKLGDIPPERYEELLEAAKKAVQ